MSKILCIIDGMTDLGFTPDSYPNLASMRPMGEVDTTRGNAPESLGCILRLLGVERVPEHLRGYGEALGFGIPVAQDDLILRGSWYQVDDRSHCVAPAPAGESLPVAPETCRYYRMEQYKSLLVFPGMACRIGDIRTHSPYRCVGRPAAELRPEGFMVLETLFDRCRGRGKCLIPWGQSVPAALPPFPEPAAVVCGTAIVRGIARLLDMALITPPGATGDTDTDLLAKISATLKAAEDYPFVLLHLNGADEAAHRRDRAGKAAFLRQVDQVVLSALLGSGHQVTVVADHGTDPETGLHLAGRQPVYRNSPER